MKSMSGPPFRRGTPRWQFVAARRAGNSSRHAALAVRHGSRRWQFVTARGAGLMIRRDGTGVDDLDQPGQSRQPRKLPIRDECRWFVSTTIAISRRADE
jgi:hypothetical protein